MFLPSFGVSAARTLLVAGLLVGGAACSHQQPVATETVRALPDHSARPEAPRSHSSDDGLARRGDAASGPAEPAIFFDFDSAELRPEDHGVLQHLADGFRARGPSQGKIRIEGNCDDLGTTEYNLALGEHRARAAKTYLIHLGVPDNRIATISYGSARPKYPDDDSGRAKNRRDDLIIR